MARTPKLSVVTAYYNRKALFLRTLTSINSSKWATDIEVVVVDDGSKSEERLEDIVNNYKFPIKLIRVEPKDKWYSNPCVPFNLGFKHATSELILIQNPECCYVGDVINQAIEATTDDNYVTFAAYSLSKDSTNKLASKHPITLDPKASTVGGQEGWYNHSKYNPRPLHFASCITKKNLNQLKGFDISYAAGIAYDDDDFLFRVKALGLQVEIVDSPFVLHQNHYDSNSFENQASKSQILLNKNRNIYTSMRRKAYKPKIIGFAQLHNELELGNLENWFKCMGVCDEIYIFDQASTDGSKEYYKNFPNAHVIESPINRFEEELICKQELLDKLLEENPDTDWIFWLDGDTLLDSRLLNRVTLEDELFKLEINNIQSGFLGHYNLWRSDVWHRVDDQYDHFMQAGRMAFWKNTGSLKFNTEPGLHKSQHPQGILTGARLNYYLIHKGFATDKQLIKKYENYKSRGQTGWALDRLLDENGLKVESVPIGVTPGWAIKDQKHPSSKKKLREIYEEEHRSNIPNL